MLEHSIEHAGAPLKLEAKTDYMKRKIEERSLAPNSAANIDNQVCALQFLCLYVSVLLNRTSCNEWSCCLESYYLSNLFCTYKCLDP